MKNNFTFVRYIAFKNFGIISIGAALLLFAVSPTLAFAQTPAPISSITSSTSANWAGYVAQGSTYSGVSGSWTVPNVSASNSGTTAADATWVGIGGVSSQDLIQAGTQAVVQNGQVQYEAWYELLPNYQTQLPLAVNAGDSVSVSLSETSANNWQITFVDNTTGKSYETSVNYQSSQSSAEWIEEMPVGGTGRALGYLPLDNFGTVSFSNTNVTTNGSQETLSAAGAQAMTMISGNQALATPSGIGSDDMSFSVTRSSVSVTQSNQYTSTGGRGWGRHGNGVQGFARGRGMGNSGNATSTQQIERIVIPLSFFGQGGIGQEFKFMFLR